MLFKDVVGQMPAKDHLISMVREDRISHAQLFTGSSGAGDASCTGFCAVC